MNLAKFEVDRDKCVGCGLCTKVCPGGVISFDESKKPKIENITEFGWDGCWKCQHCLAVCPKGAISVLGKEPANSLLPVSSAEAAPVLDSLITNRRACRRYLDKNVDKETIKDMLSILQNAPSGGNRQHVEYTLFDDKEQTKIFRDTAYAEMERQASGGIYAEAFDEKSYGQLKEWETTVRPDMLLCSAPHLLIPHAPLGRGCAVQDVNIACAYFELLCASRELGAIMMSYPLDVLKNMPKIKALLNIPEKHYIGTVVGFGYAEINYARGVQREESAKVHRIAFENEVQQ